MIETTNPEISIEELMQRIRAEIAQRKTAQCGAGTQASFSNSRLQFDASVKNNPGLPPLAVQAAFDPKPDGQYHIKDLLCYHDQAFMNAAYRAILRRPPDSSGNNHYLRMLRNGCAKVDILGRLRYSREGRVAGVKISGLAAPFLLQQVYRIPVFGRFIQIIAAIWHLSHLERNQRKFENHIISLIEQVQNHFRESCRTMNESLVQSIETRAEHHELTTLSNHLISMVESRLQKEDLQPVEQFLDRLNQQIAGAQSAFEAEQTEIRSALEPVKAQTHDLKRNILDQERRLGLLLEEARKRLPEPITTGQIEAMLTEDDHRLDAMYASFEDRFRGTREDIKQRQSIYLPIVLEAKAGNEKAPVLDLGCGRGEWLELLRQEGFIARGVDLNRIFLEICREMELDVVEQDAVAYLRTLKPNSIGAVSAFHLIEHLPLKPLIALLDETLRVLQPGGLVILETPNPGNVQVGSCNFYFDPTHRNPLPGPLTQYLLEARGFSRTHFMPLHPYDSLDRLTEGEQEVQRVFNQFFFGPQDYAVLAYKS